METYSKMQNYTNSKETVQRHSSSQGFLFILLFFCPFQSEYKTYQGALNLVYEGKNNV